MVGHYSVSCQSAPSSQGSRLVFQTMVFQLIFATLNVSFFYEKHV